MSGRVVVAALAACSVAWFALVVLAPELPSALAAVVYGIGGVVCHQRPERSFHWHGAQLAVCARCTGLYLGACASAILVPLPPSFYAGWSGPPERLAWRLGLAALPLAATVAVEWLGMWAPSATVRAGTGVLLGAAGALVVAAAFSRPNAAK